MEALQQLLRNLNKGEMEVLRTSLKFGNGKAKAEKRSLKLLDFLLQKGDLPPDKEISDSIYGKSEARSKISMLKKRLKDKIVDTFLFDVNLNRIIDIDPPDSAIIRVRKKLAQFQYLNHTKKNIKVTQEVLSEVIEISKEHELYSSLVEALKYKKWAVGFKVGEKEFDKLNKEIAFYDYCNKALNNAADYYYRLIIKSNFEGNSSQKINAFISKSINDLKKDAVITKSTFVMYYLKLLQFIYQESNGKYLQARSTCLELIDIIRNNKSVFRKQRIGNAYDYISLCETHLRNYKQAIEYAQLAMNNMIVGSVDYFVANEHQFYPLFFDKQFKQAEAVSLIMIESVNPELGDFRYSKYRFFHANALFSQGKYKEALKLLNEHFYLSADKAGWDIAVRVLGIMCDLEMNSMESASLKVENLRKHIEYNSKDHDVKERDERIVKVLHYLEANGFQYDKSNSKLVANVDLLHNSKNCRWQPFSPELVVFHEWLDKKYLLKRTREKVFVEE